MLNTVHCMDALALCHAIADAGLQADMILCDLPYGTTACAWDTVIPFAPMWEAFKRVIKPRGAIVLTASQPFTSALVMSNPTWFKYCWYWEKEQGAGFNKAKFQPMRTIEDVAVFCRDTSAYYPIMARRPSPIVIHSSYKKNSDSAPLKYRQTYIRTSHETYPTTLLKFQRDRDGGERGLHPTQKPVALFEYLIRTYTQPGELVIDPCVGSGTTAVAARNTGRNYIVGDSSPEYYAVACKRLALPFTLPMFERAEAVE